MLRCRGVSGQNLLREAMLIADHNSYHTAEIVVARRLLKKLAMNHALIPSGTLNLHWRSQFLNHHDLYSTLLPYHRRGSAGRLFLFAECFYPIRCNPRFGHH
jgi:hypothetical protein